jgi:hypothetical protein
VRADWARLVCRGPRLCCACGVDEVTRFRGAGIPTVPTLGCQALMHLWSSASLATLRESPPSRPTRQRPVSNRGKRIAALARMKRC